MTDRLDTLLREVIHDLAAEGDLVRSEDRDRRRFALDCHRPWVPAPQPPAREPRRRGRARRGTRRRRSVRSRPRPSRPRARHRTRGEPIQQRHDRTRRRADPRDHRHDAADRVGGRVVRAGEQLRARLAEQDVLADRRAKRSRLTERTSGSALGRVLSMNAAATASPTSAPARPTPTAPKQIVGIGSGSTVVARRRPTAVLQATHSVSLRPAP